MRYLLQQEEENLNNLWKATEKLAGHLAAHDYQEMKEYLSWFGARVHLYTTDHLTTPVLSKEIKNLIPIDLFFVAYITLALNQPNLLVFQLNEPSSSICLFQDTQNILLALRGDPINALLNEAFRITCKDGYTPSFFGILNLLDKLPLIRSSLTKENIILLISTYAEIIKLDNQNRETLFSMRFEQYGRDGRSAWDSIEEGIHSNDECHFKATVTLFEGMQKLPLSEKALSLSKAIEKRKTTSKDSLLPASSEDHLTPNGSAQLQASFETPTNFKKIKQPTTAIPYRYAGPALLSNKKTNASEKPTGDSSLSYAS